MFPLIDKQSKRLVSRMYVPPCRASARGYKPMQPAGFLKLKIKSLRDDKANLGVHLV